MLKKRKKLCIAVTIVTLLFVVVMHADRSIFLSAATRLQRLAARIAPSSAGRTKGGRFQLPRKDAGSTEILLMTYGRSGSTLMTEIIGEDPSVFYILEPLWRLMRRHLGKGGSNSYLVKEKDNYDKQSVDIIEVFLTCGFRPVKSADTKDHEPNKGIDVQLFYSCVCHKRNWTSPLHCFLNARTSCLGRPVKLVKTIRLRGSAAKLLMERNPGLSVLYLIRDPRGAITSQHRNFHNFAWDDADKFAANYCQTVREDLSDMGKLIDRFPDRVKLLRYESLAENPLRVSEEVYRFLGLNYSDSVRTFVSDRTMAGKMSSAFRTFRSNSTLTAYRWRTDMKIKRARKIDWICRDVYQTLGYLPAKTARELKNLSHPLRTPAVFHGHVL